MQVYSRAWSTHSIVQKLYCNIARLASRRDFSTPVTAFFTQFSKLIKLAAVDSLRLITNLGKTLSAVAVRVNAVFWCIDRRDTERTALRHMLRTRNCRAEHVTQMQEVIITDCMLIVAV